MAEALSGSLKQRMRQCCLIACFCLLLPQISNAQPNAIPLQYNPASRYFSLQKFPWRFHPGDNMQWASPSLNDAGWDTTRTDFGEKDLPGNWTGFGWFRIWIKKTDPSLINTWGMYINHDGASEIYFDGRKVAALGKPGTSRQTSRPERAPYLTIPLAITDTQPHLLAIRYCNYHHFFPDFVGFQVWLGDLHFMDQKQKADQHFFDYLLMSGAAMAILVLLHMLLYIFYPKQRVNLYYSLFVFGTTVSLFTRCWAIDTHDPGNQLLFYQIFSASISVMPFLFALLLYHVSGPRLPRLKLLIIGMISVVFTLIYFFDRNIDLLSINSTIGYLNNLFTVLVMTDGLIAVFKAIRRGNKRLWLIGIGILLVVLGSVIVGANTFRIFTFYQLMTGMSILCLVMPVLFSVYIAMDVASNNRKLAIQLKENERLSAENLAKEQEKNKIISGQAEQLEKTVLERTAQVREQAERLKEMDAAKSRFFVNLTHEFKTPLTLIINPARELLKQPDAAAARQYAGFILQNSERLLQLINQLLDLSRLENGQMDISRQSIDIVRWLQLHVQQFSSLAEHHHINLEISGNITSLLVNADVDKLEKIIQNLISNAIKFSNRNDTVEVVFTKKENGFIEITVKDNGIGISARKLPYIFDRFYQADASDTRSREGAGIGLALVKELTELLGGTISVSSIENSGTTFTIQLPCLPADATVAETPGETDLHDEEAAFLSATNGHTTNHTETILIAEDNEQLRQFMEISLQEGYNVLSARDGEEGIALATGQIPTLVITDLMMPGKNGYELCNTLKKDERTSHIPVIMLTAKTDQESKILGIETGADAYLPKPFDKRELLAHITNLIHTRKQLREKYSRNNNWLSGNIELPSIEQVFLERVKQAIIDRLDDTGFSAEQLGKDVGLSRTQLHRKLKDLIDQSPGELIRTIRMRQAHELLKKNTGTVAEVSYMVGYGNPANFATSFTKHFGYPPSDAKKN